MIRFLNVFYSPDGGGGGGDGGAGDGGGDGGTPAPEWHGDVAYFKDNPEAAKAFGKYKTMDDAFKGAHEAIKRFGKPYHLPEDGSKLTDAQRAELKAGVAKLNGVPETPDGYEITAPDGAVIDEQGIADFKAFAHEHGIDPKTAQGLVDFQLAFVDRLNKARGKVIEGMTNNNYKTFLNEDCGGDKEVAGARLEMVKNYLQTFCTKDGKPDPKTWESFSARIMHNDRMIELPLLRALHEAAQMKVGTGGAPGSFGQPTGKGGALSYAEMDGK